jgi:hypothetical protein
MERHTSRKQKPDLSETEVREILVHAMGDVGADPALVYAFQKTGVYVCEENEKGLPKKSLKAFDTAVDEYFAALKRPLQSRSFRLYQLRPCGTRLLEASTEMRDLVLLMSGAGGVRDVGTKLTALWRFGLPRANTGAF